MKGEKGGLRINMKSKQTSKDRSELLCVCDRPMSTCIALCRSYKVLYCICTVVHSTAQHCTVHLLSTHLEVILSHHSSDPGCFEIHPTHTPPGHLVLLVARSALLVLAPSEWRVQSQQVGCRVLEQQPEQLSWIRMC
jgi:hypothetical protein